MMTSVTSWFGSGPNSNTANSQQNIHSNTSNMKYFGSIDKQDRGSNYLQNVRSSLAGSSSSIRKRPRTVQEIVKVLYPSRKSSTVVSSNSSRGSFNGSNASSLCNSNHSGGSTTRFTPLLLEYGEKHIQDWAVVGYSSSVTISNGSRSNKSKTKASTSIQGSGNGVNDDVTMATPAKVQNRDSNHGLSTGSSLVTKIDQTKNITWFQSPELNKKNNTLIGDSNSTPQLHQDNHNRQKQRQKDEYMERNRHTNHPTTNHMKNIHGRLHLCTNSIVFEPDDTSRGIIRCPFLKTDFPTIIPLDGTATDIQFTSRRYYVLKEDNVIGPYRQVSETCQFRFTFLHSSPKQFLEIFQIIHTANASSRQNHARIMMIDKLLFQLQHQRQNDYEIIRNIRNHFINVREQIIQPTGSTFNNGSNNSNNKSQSVSSIINCSVLTPLQKENGIMIITNERIYYQKQQSSPQYSTNIMKYNIRSIVATARRYCGLRDNALEIFIQDDYNIPKSKNTNHNNASYSSILFGFERRHDREVVLRCIQQSFAAAVSGSGNDLSSFTQSYHYHKYNSDSTNVTTETSIPCLTDREFVIQVSKEWRRGSISNYEYLLALNCASGRTVHDLSRYPVFPWIIADYKSKQLDFSKESTFRDLTQPIGALNAERLQYFQKRLSSMHDMNAHQQGNNEFDAKHNEYDDAPFLYGTHYSAPGYVLYFLVRTMPEHMLCLQNGKFDAPDRMFHSISNCYSCVLSNHADIKELTPEFYNPYYEHDYLLNIHGLQLGSTQNNEYVNDVVLPPWAKTSKDFIKQNCLAMESSICTSMIHNWIDLIFGYKSRGASALEHNNLFHQYSYFGPNDLASMKTEQDRCTAELQATEFGIVPDQLFIKNHPSRFSSPSDELDDKNYTTTADGVVVISRNDENDYISPDIGRASSSKDDSMSGREAWELLDVPTALGIGMNSGESENDYDRGPIRSNDNQIVILDKDARVHPDQDGIVTSDMNDSFGMHDTIEITKASSIESQANFQGFEVHHSADLHVFKESASSSTSSWDMQVIERKRIHNDAISGCVLVLEDMSTGTNRKSILATTSLDGSLKVHNVSFENPTNDEDGSLGNAFSTTFNRLMSNRGQATSLPTAILEAKLSEYRSHSSRDPIASLSLTSDGNDGMVAFVGGHDDIVLAYGIKSNCAVASVYSHRDAVTGLDLIHRTPFDSESSIWLENSTHVLISGSWDSTVKVWSISVSRGETVSINREPIAEFVDCESSVVCVSSRASLPSYEDEGIGIVIAAGCADGSFCVWNLHSDGVQVLIHKEPAKPGSGACSVLKWACEGGSLRLFAAFSGGKIAAYKLISRSLKRENAVSIGFAILSMVYAPSFLLVGCADGGLRLLSIKESGSIDSSLRPVLWSAVHNSSTSPGISSLSLASNGYQADNGFDAGNTIKSNSLIFCSGAEDGSIVLFELKAI